MRTPCGSFRRAGLVAMQPTGFNSLYVVTWLTKGSPHAVHAGCYHRAASLAGVLHAVHAMDTGVKGPIGLIGGIGAFCLQAVC